MKTVLSLLLALALLMGHLPARAETTTVIELNGTNAVITGGGASCADGVITIQAEGEYILSGTLTGGQIVVEATKEEKVTLRLMNVTITNPNAPCIFISSCDKTVIDLVQGSENLLVSGVEMPAATDEEASGAALQAKDDLKIKGTGRLTVRGYLNNGIQTSNDLVIDGGIIDVTAANNGIKGKDSLSVRDGSVTVTSLGDGLVSQGDIDISGGSVAITSGGGHTIAASTELPTQITAESVPDSAPEMPADNQTPPQADQNSSATERGKTRDGANGGFMGVFGGNAMDRGGRVADGNANKAEDAPSAKGVKSETSIIISGGTLTVDSRDDGLHAANITISDGSLTVSSNDDGLHADETLSISGGSVRVPVSYEGLEGKNVLISGGEVSVYATDDGINAADGSAAGAMQGRMPTANSEDAPRLEISGGNVVVIAEVDGLDSNGNLVISGGTTLVRGQNSSFDGAIDADYTPVITGGTLFAIGGITGFAQTSSQCAFVASFSNTVLAGETVTVAAADGTIIYRATLPRDLLLFAFSAPQLTVGESYTVTAGSETATIAQTSLISGSASANGGMDRGNMNKGGMRR